MSDRHRIVTLTTDFGTNDAYVAAVKGVILSINPEVVTVDICHSITPQNILEAAFLISTVHKYFPDGTIHVVVVDPGVGSNRKAIILKTPSAFFVAPDNGVLSYIIAEFATNKTFTTNELRNINPRLKLQKISQNLEAVAITNPNFWLHPVSATFHARDIFAPTAAHLSLGIPLNEFGEKLTQVHAFPIPRPYRDPKGNITGHILHIDNFGNLITDIKSSDLPQEEVTILIGKHCIRKLSQFYAQSKGLLALIGSSGYLEIAYRNGNAASILNAKVGDKVTLKIAKTVCKQKHGA